MGADKPMRNGLILFKTTLNDSREQIILNIKELKLFSNNMQIDSKSIKVATENICG